MSYKNIVEKTWEEWHSGKKGFVQRKQLIVPLLKSQEINIHHDSMGLFMTYGCEWSSLIGVATNHLLSDAKFHFDSLEELDSILEASKETNNKNRNDFLIGF